MTRIPPSDNSYRTFCDLVSGYRMFHVINEAIRSGVMDLLEEGGLDFQDLLGATPLQPDEGGRFIELLVNVGLLEQYDGRLFLSRFSRAYLSRSSADCQRAVLEFEPLLMENWRNLGTYLRKGQGGVTQEKSPAECRERVELFQRAMAEAAAVRSRELWDQLTFLSESGIIIDIGGGDGTYLRSFLAMHPGWQAVACDLPDVCARFADQPSPENPKFHPCNILDQKELSALVATYKAQADILLLSNICHCFGPDENAVLVQQVSALLAEEGVLILHDFFRDADSFGAMYDLHMLVNTYNGRCYSTAETVAFLEDAGLKHHLPVELPSGSLAIVATRNTPYGSFSSIFNLKTHALSLGLSAAVEFDPACIQSEAWVRAKCAYGCSGYGRRWSCPPHSMDQAGFEELLKCYSRALLVVGQPPLHDFQGKLLNLEREAFLGGFKKALVFTGGPCCWCQECDALKCRFPEKRRPSLESCGCDVFALAERCGVSLAPLRNSNDFVQYVGLLLVD